MVDKVGIGQISYIGLTTAGWLARTWLDGSPVSYTDGLDEETDITGGCLSYKHYNPGTNAK